MKSGLVNQVKLLELVRCLRQTSVIQQRYQFAPHPLKECSDTQVAERPNFTALREVVRHN